MFFSLSTLSCFFSAIYWVSMKHVLKSSRALFGRDRREESRLDLAQGFQVSLVGPLGPSTPWIVKVLGGCHPHRIHGAAYMLCHGSHQYTPCMLAHIPAPWILWDLWRAPITTSSPALRRAGPGVTSPAKPPESPRCCASLWRVLWHRGVQIQTLSWARCAGANHPGPTALFLGKVGALFLQWIAGR